MEDLPRAVAFADPMTAMFQITEEMRQRGSRIRYALLYAALAGMALTVICAIALALFVVAFFLSGTWDVGPEELAFLALVLVASAVGWRWAGQSLVFFNGYSVMAAAVNRAMNWSPHPDIPPGSDPVHRLLAYLREHDDRFGALIARKPKALEVPAQLRGRSKQMQAFEAHFSGTAQWWYKIPEGVRVFVRVRPRITIEEIRSMKSDLEDVLSGEDQPAVKAILLQTEIPEFSDEIVAFVNENWFGYQRLVGGVSREWTAPIELMAESEQGMYNFGSFYFG